MKTAYKYEVAFYSEMDIEMPFELHMNVENPDNGSLIERAMPVYFWKEVYPILENIGFVPCDYNLIICQNGEIIGHIKTQFERPVGGE